MRRDAAQGAQRARRERGVHRRAWLHGTGALIVTLVIARAWQPLQRLRKRCMPPGPNGANPAPSPDAAAAQMQTQTPVLPRWIGHC